MYADLVSPMDYALLKPRTAFEKEKDEVIAQAHPCSFDTSVPLQTSFP